MEDYSDQSSSDYDSDQESTIDSYTRPQQPTEAFAATLPVETLTRIFELALAGFVWPDEEKGQAQRVQCGLVCRSWCSFALPLPHYTVSSSAKAQRLAQVLKATDRSRRAVRSLDITAEAKKSSGQGAKIAKLLSLCPKLERLALELNRELCAPARRREDGSLGKVVRDGLCGVPLREAGLFGVSLLPISVLDELFEAWPNLEILSLMHIGTDTLDKSAPFEFNHPPSHLIDLRLSDVKNLELIGALLRATQNTLERLDVGEVCISEGGKLMEAVKIVAPQLAKFTMRDAEQDQRADALAKRGEDNVRQVEGLVKAMPLLRSLTIGFNGLDLNNLFSLLAELKHLRYFSLSHTHNMKSTATAVAIYLSQLSFEGFASCMSSAPTSLRSVALPAALAHDDWWPDDELAGLSSMLAENGIELTLGE